MPPLRGLAPLVLTLLHRCRPYGTEEHIFRGHFIDDLKGVPPETVLLVVKNTSIFLKLTPMGRCWNPPTDSRKPMADV